MFNSSVFHFTSCFSLASLILINSHVLSHFGTSATFTNNWVQSGEDVFDKEVWQKLKEEHFLKYKPMSAKLGLYSWVNSIVRDENSSHTSFLVGTDNGLYRIDAESMTVTDKWNATKRKDSLITAIMIDYKTHPKPSIISCGSTQNGVCRLHNYSRLKVSQWIGNPDDPVNSVVGAYKSQVITESASSNTIFFIHHRYDFRPLTQSPPLLSARILEIPASGPPTFRYARQENAFNSSCDIHPKLKRKFPTDIERVFVYDGFLYYVRTYLLNSRLRTRLGRISLDNLSFTYYEETELVCKHEDDYFAILTDAYFESDNIGNSSSSFLVGSFEQTGYLRKQNSIFCIFSMEAIQRKFREDDSKCSPNSSFISTHSTDVGSIFYKKSRDCTDDSEKDEVDNEFCWIPLKHRVLKCPLESNSVWESSRKIHSFVTDQQEDNKILFYTEPGYIRKVVLPSHKPSYLAFTQANDLPHGRNLVLSKELLANKKAKDSFVYFGEQTELVKFPLTSCSIYRTCVSCLASNDTLECGWCGTHCARRSECREKDFSHETCPPIVYGFYPQKAPLAGGTILELRGQNFGERKYGSLRILGVDCPSKNIKHWDFNSIEVLIPPFKSEATGFINVSLFDQVPFHTSYSNKTFYSFGTSISYSKFKYANPTFERVIPVEGLVSKRIEVHVIGKNFDITSSKELVKVQLTTSDEKLIYFANVVNSTHIRFQVYSESATPSTITIFFGEYRTETGLVFHFIGDPVIESVDTKTARCSGETSIIVKGSNFHEIQNMKLGMHFNSDPENRTNCRVDTGNQMTCFAPKCPFNLKSGEQYWANPSFYTQSFRINIPESYAWQISYFPDPKFDNVAEDTKVYIDDPVLQLSGSDLYFGSNILISVGNWTCELLPEQQKANQLFCKIQFEDDLPVEGDSVAVGYSLRENDETHNLGNVVFLSRSTPEAVGFLKKHWYIPVTTAVVILSFAIAIGYWKLRQRRNEGSECQDRQELELPEYEDEISRTSSISSAF